MGSKTFTSWPSVLSSLLSGFIILLATTSSHAARVNQDRRTLNKRQAALPTLPVDPTTPRPSTECTNSVYSIGRYLQYHYICCDGNTNNPLGQSAGCPNKVSVDYLKDLCFLNDVNGDLDG